MNSKTDSAKLAKLQELDALLPREIRGQSHALPRIISVIRRGELSLTKPSRPRGSFLLLGPTGVGKTETVLVTTTQIFSPGQLFRFDMSEFQTQDALGLLAVSAGSLADLPLNLGRVLSCAVASRYLYGLTTRPHK